MRPRQALGRLRRPLPPAMLAAGIEPASELSPRPVAAGLGLEAAPQSGPVPPAHEEGAFCAVGRSRAFPSAGFWSDQGDGLLFLFHLHGFAALAEYAAGSRTATADAFWADVVSSWLEQHSRPSSPAWHPFPTSIRVVSWAAAVSAIDAWPEALRRRLTASLVHQALYLRRTIEHDIGGNHVLKNAKALIFAGAVGEDDGLSAAGLRLLERELRSQVLADGGHEERSTSYHREICRDLSELVELLGRTGRGAPAWLEEASAAMEGWLEALAGPDGGVPLLNDAWEGPPLGGPTGAAVQELASSGYTALRGESEHMVVDAGPMCPPHLPPHAHADVLSVVLWADGHPLLVDPGSCTYSGPDRDAFRSTAAHNTVEVEGQSQCLFWGDFRAAFQPRVRRFPARPTEGAVVVGGSHDGYRRLPEPVDHARRVVWWPGEGVVLVDLLSGHGAPAFSSPLHVAPDVEVSAPSHVGPFEVAPLTSHGELGLRQGRYSPHLGRSLPAAVIDQRGRVECGVPFGWSLLRSGRRVVELDRDRVVLARDDGSSTSVHLAFD